MIPREIELQESVTSWLLEHDISPASVTLSYKFFDGILAVTFYFRQDLNEFLDLVDYKYSCDKSGYVILEDTNTVFLHGLPLVKLYTVL